MAKGELDQSLRQDGEKLRLDLFPVEWMEGLTKVLMMGAAKYAPNDWMQRPRERLRMYNSCQRHINAMRKGEVLDPESGLDHRLHAAWNLLADWYYDEKGMERPDES